MTIKARVTEWREYNSALDFLATAAPSLLNLPDRTFDEWMKLEMLARKALATRRSKP